MEIKRESPFIGAGTPYDNQTSSIHVQIHKKIVKYEFERAECSLIFYIFYLE